MSGGSNGAGVIINAAPNVYDRAICFDAPVEMDTGLYTAAAEQRTLANLRTELMRRLGFAAMVGNPPAGMPELLNSFLQDAHEQLYWRYSCLRTERWWGWQTSAGQRFYDVPIDCTKALNFRKITWAGVADNGGRAVQQWNDLAVLTLGTFVIPTIYGDFDYEVTTAGTTGVSEPTWPTLAGQTVVNGSVTFTARAKPRAQWYPLIDGIDPMLFNLDTTRMRPSHYEVREFLEIYPTPDKTYVIWLKGHLGLKRFTEDNDRTTIDSHPVFLTALANAKAHYGQPDAKNYVSQVEVMIRKLVAGGHGTRKYVPGTKVQPPAVRPVIV